MKSLIRLLIASCALLGASASIAANNTYTVVGYFDRNQPDPELVAKVAGEIAAKMKDLTAVRSEADADQIVQVLFKRDGTYRIYWDALPLMRNGRRYQEHDKPMIDLNVFRSAEGKSGQFPPK